MKRCHWADPGDPLYLEYHDREWGVPVHDDRELFEMLILEGAQAGLSWSTILHKREGYRRAFERFDPKRVARFDARKLRALLKDPGIVRNRLKIAAAVTNAKAILKTQKEFGSFDAYIWRFADGRPRAQDKMSDELKKRGFRFVGPTICYAFMQAVGMVNDHAKDCFKHPRKKRN